MHSRKHANDKAKQLPDSTLYIKRYNNRRGWPRTAYERGVGWLDSRYS